MHKKGIVSLTYLLHLFDLFGKIIIPRLRQKINNNLKNRGKSKKLCAKLTLSLPLWGRWILRSKRRMRWNTGAFKNLFRRLRRHLPQRGRLNCICVTNGLPKAPAPTEICVRLRISNVGAIHESPAGERSSPLRPFFI